MCVKDRAHVIRFLRGCKKFRAAALLICEDGCLSSESGCFKGVKANLKEGCLSGESGLSEYSEIPSWNKEEEKPRKMIAL